MTMAHAALLFVISLHAVGHALLAFSPGHLPGGAIAVLVASVFGFLIDRQGGGAEAGSRRVRGAIWGIYAAFLIGAFTFVTSGQAPAVSLGLYVLLACQVTFLIIPNLDRGRVTVLVNAQALCALASLVGGVVAVSALAGHAVLFVIFVALDHRLRRGMPLSRAIPGMIVPLLLVVAVLGSAFTLDPPRPNERLLSTVRAAVAEVDPGVVIGAWAKLIGVALAGLGLLLLARRLLRGRRKGEVELELDLAELRRPRARPRRRTARPSVEPVDVSGARGRIVRAYLRLLRRAARRGRPRAPSQTPAEHARGLPGPARDVARIFGRARYGRARVSDADADAFERAAKDVARALSRER